MIEDPSCVEPSLRKLAWAGLRMACPKTWRFASIQGDAQQGRLILADTSRARLELAWARPKQRDYDGQKFARTRLKRAAKRKDWEDHLTPVANDHYKPLLGYRDPAGKIDRYAGYSPAGRRVIEMAYHRDNPREDHLVERHLLTSLRDQSLEVPNAWSFYDVSFVSPSGYRYESARLNLGDMRVRLIAGSRRWNGPRLTIGQIYPAKLALKRQDLPQWTRTLAAELRSHYRPATGNALQVHTWESAGQTIAQADMVLRRRFRPLLLRTPRPLRLYVIHHPQEDRLTFINLSDRVIDRIDEHFALIHESLHWAGLSS